MGRFSVLGIQKKSLLIILLVYLTSSMIVGTIFLCVYQYERTQERKRIVEETLFETADHLNVFLKNTDDLAYNTLYSTWVQKIFDKGLTNYEKQKRISNVQTVMNTLSFLDSDVQFAVFMPDGISFHSNEWYMINQEYHVEDERWFSRLNENRKYLWSGMDQQLFYNNPEWCILSWYAINNINTLELEAYAAVRISQETFAETVFARSEYRNCYLAFLDDQNRVLYSEMPEELEEEGLELLENSPASEFINREYTVMKKAVLIGEKEYFLFCLLENDKVTSVGYLYLLIFLGILILLGGMLISLSYGISHYITRPVLNICNGMREISNNNFGVVIQNPYQDEFGEMIDSFNQMSTSIQNLIRINKQISIMQKDAEYQLLERQINPHFLFNNLELINSLILSQKADEARTVCETLGKLYRYNLKKKRYITLNEEMEYTRHYLYLMTYKIHNLTFFYNMDENLKNVEVPKVILQPLVENSIKHGFSDPERDYCITLLAESTDEEIHITVMDNGSGISEDKLAVIRKELLAILTNPTNPLEESAHIGLKNVVQRMALEYGHVFAVSIYAKEGSGTRIELIIKKERG